MYFVFTDGASKGNPGKASIGGVCFENDIPSLQAFMQGHSAVFQISETIGIKTNNEAEYLSLIQGLTELIKRNILKAQIFMDSELVIRQVKGIYKVKKDSLRFLYNQVMELAGKGSYDFQHIPREKNQIADYLANQAIKNQQ